MEIEISKGSLFNTPMLIELMSSEAFYYLKLNLNRANGILFPIDKATIANRHKGKRKNVNAVPSSTMFKYPPTSAAFFGVYNQTKTKLEHHAYSENLNQSICHIFAVYAGHTASCLFRVPVDIYKAEKKVQPSYTPFQQIKRIVNMQNIWLRSYKNLTFLIFRELPFCSIKFPFWEFLKIEVESLKESKTIETYESALCGALAGGTAAVLTLPVDLAYKRIYIDKQSEKYKRWKTLLTLRDMAAENGIKGLFAGYRNRFAMISFGGLLFFGCYEQKKTFLNNDSDEN